MVLVSHAELFFGFIDAGCFQDVYLPLIVKSFNCGVPKIQNLAVQQIVFLSKNLEYMSFKNQILPLLMKTLESSDNHDLKLKGLEVLIAILPSLDKNYLRDNVLVTLEKLRENNNDTEVNMHLLTLYDLLASALTPEDIGQRILPGMIPMLISASLSKSQFQKLLKTIRTLLD